MKAKENAPLTTSSKVAVLFEVTPKKEYKETYLQLGAMLKSELTNMPGFISVERFLSLNEEGKLLSLSFWENEEAASNWRNKMNHRNCQKKGHDSLFEKYKISVAEVIRQYTPLFDNKITDMTEYFQYGEKELSYLKQRDTRLSEIIDKVGWVKRRVIPNLFAALVHSIVGQQISTKAHETIWQRIQSSLGEITPQRVTSLTDEELQRFGISFKKVTYIKRAATKILNGEFDIHGLYDKTDEEVIECLSKLDGIGIWSAEMLMLFSMQRPDILSYSDLAIQRGLRMVYHHRDITRKLFEKYRRRYSPYNSVASLYLWAVAGGAIEGMKDYAATKKKRS